MILQNRYTIPINISRRIMKYIFIITHDIINGGQIANKSTHGPDGKQIEAKDKTWSSVSNSA